MAILTESTKDDQDTVIEEMRRIKDELARIFDHDVSRIGQDARERRKTSGHRILTRRKPAL